MLQRLKQIINHETLSGWFALMSVIIVSWNWIVSIVLMGLALIHWYNPERKNKIQ